jgi:S-adenosylmethionine synthetase
LGDTSPIHLLIVGRATKRSDGDRIPTESIALADARVVLEEGLTVDEIEADGTSISDAQQAHVRM